MKTVVLASGSPRRKEILGWMRIPFIVDVSDYEEDMTLNLPPRELVKHLSLEKARSVADRHQDSIIIGADTFAILDGKLLGKPGTPERAYEHLSLLSGKTCSVIYGYAVLDTESRKNIVKSGVGKVVFRSITHHEMQTYIATGDPLDRAGAFGIQGYSAMFIKKIIGDYTGFLGLPLCSLVETLKKFGIEPLKNI